MDECVAGVYAAWLWFRERPQLANIVAVHLQGHIGTDTLSLHRLAARMTGLDFSPASLTQARALAQRTGAGVRFVESELYGALDVLPAGGFDLVYTGIGALCRLPDIARWAATVAALLRPGGRLFVRDLHPMLATIAVVDGRLVVEDPYFERPDPNVWKGGGTYVAADVPFASTESHSWSHGLGETVSALLAEGLAL